jgi:hypothetical protein
MVWFILRIAARHNPVPTILCSVGHVNAELFTLAAGKRLSSAKHPSDEEHPSSSLKLIDRYREVLCVNSWQVRASPADLIALGLTSTLHYQLL